MLYTYLKFLMTLTVRTFFRGIVVRKKENIPLKGPLIICANHPSTFMDPIVIGTLVGRKLFFLAKGEVFKSGFAKLMLPKLNMIPVYRKQDDPTLMHKNEETFERCFDHLANNGVILIFPEGISLTERKLRKIKTGAARIALGAESRHGFKLGVKILNIGLNYENPHQFGNDLFVNIDEPIDVTQYGEKYRLNPAEAAHELTERIRSGLESLIVNIDDENTDKLVKKIERIYKRKFAKDVGVDQKNPVDDFDLTRRIVNAVRYYRDQEPEFVERVSADVDNYLWKLEMANLKDELLDDSIDRYPFLIRNLLSIILLVFGFPVYLYGVFINYIPYQIPSLIVNAVVSADEWTGAIAMISGTFTFMIYYGFLILTFLYTGQDLSMALLFAASLPISGFFAYFYFHHFLEWKSNWSFLSLFHKRTRLVSELIVQRKRIIDDLNHAANVYREKMGITL